MFDPHSSSDKWPDEIGILPFVGKEYGKFRGQFRILLLGESHYHKPQEDDSTVDVRNYTRNEFSECEHNLEKPNRAWGTFFRRCDTIVTGKEFPSNSEAELGWSQVAYANYIQEIIGNNASARPKSRMWEDASSIFPVLIDCLKPDAIVVLGAMVWKDLSENSLPIGTIPARHVDREVVEIRHDKHSTIATWAYHPRSRKPKDAPSDYIGVTNSLFDILESRMP